MLARKADNRDLRFRIALVPKGHRYGVDLREGKKSRDFSMIKTHSPLSCANQR